MEKKHDIGKEAKEKEVKEEGKRKKGIVKKNQLVIAALTVLLGVAGYLNFSGNMIDLADGSSTETAFSQNSNDELSGEITIADMSDDEYMELNSDEANIGEAVLTSANTASMNFVNLKLNREQTRSKSKEYYLDIINGDESDEASVQSATDAYIKLTEEMEKEADAEAILAAKGFVNSLVSIGDDSVDVILEVKELTDADRAKIEDIIVRKTGYSIDKINITTIDINNSKDVEDIMSKDIENEINKESEKVVEDNENNTINEDNENNSECQ